MSERGTSEAESQGQWREPLIEVLGARAATITTGSLNLTIAIDALPSVLSDRVGGTTDKIKVRTIELFEFPAKQIILETLAQYRRY